MSDINLFIRQQTGFLQWRSMNTALCRLRCHKSEEYSQILLTEGEWNSDAVEPPIFACKFAQKAGYENILALANEDGKLAIHNTKSNNRYGYDAHRNAVFDLAWMFDQMKLVTVSGDHTACLQEVSESEIRPTQIFEGHTRSVKTVAFRYNDSNVFATGGRDGTILTWDARSNRSMIGKVDCCLFNTHRFTTKTPTSTVKLKRKKSCLSTTVSGADSVTGLVFQNENSLISCGASDGQIKVWDMRKTYNNYTHDPVPKYILPYQGNSAKNGFSNLILDRSCMKLYANCLDNSIYCYNVGTYDGMPHMKYSGHENSTFYVKSCLSPNGEFLISGSSDHNAYIWDVVASTTPIVKLAGHQAEVTCVAWCPSQEVIVVTCSDDLKHKFWKIDDEEIPENWEVEGAGEAAKIKPQQRGRGRKRDSSDMDFVGRTKRCLEEGGEGDTRPIKILKSSFGPRKLFACVNQNCTSEHFKINLTKVETPSTKKPKYEEKENDEITTMIPLSEDELEEEMPKKRLKLDSECETVIKDLPNFVFDGKAPHLNVSPVKKVEKDWLTKIRDEKSSFEVTKTTSSPSGKSELCNTPKSRQKSKKGPSSSPHSPLLKFFKVTSSNSQQCSPKSSNLSSYTHYNPSSII